MVLITTSLPGSSLAARRNLVLKRRRENPDEAESESGSGAAQTNKEPDAWAAQAARERQCEEARKKAKQDLKESWMGLVADGPDSLPRKRHNC